MTTNLQYKYGETRILDKEVNIYLIIMCVYTIDTSYSLSIKGSGVLNSDLERHL
jgi:hypothetical protein